MKHLSLSLIFLFVIVASYALYMDYMAGRYVPVTAGVTTSNNLLPNPRLTPGVINDSVTQGNIHQTICKAGWTGTIRPASSYTTTLKIKQIKQYGYSDTNPKNYEEDHLISLELGGSPTDPQNLWPEAYPSAHDKDKVENELHREVCNGSITLKEAQRIISTDWLSFFNKKLGVNFGAVSNNDNDDNG